MTDYEIAFVGLDGQDQTVLAIGVRHRDPTATHPGFTLRVSRACLLEFAGQLLNAWESDHVRKQQQDAKDVEMLRAATPSEDAKAPAADSTPEAQP
jgi:hypothetical protein